MSVYLCEEGFMTSNEQLKDDERRSDWVEELGETVVKGVTNEWTVWW